MSYTDSWTTPLDFFKLLNDEFSFDLDPCATPENAKCKAFYTEYDDGLTQMWWGRVFVNPPYSRITEWLVKCWNAACNEAKIVVALVPSKTDTAWWHDLAMRADEIRFVRGRLRFGGSKENAPFPSAVLIYDRTRQGFTVVKSMERR